MREREDEREVISIVCSRDAAALSVPVCTNSWYATYRNAAWSTHAPPFIAAQQTEQCSLLLALFERQSLRETIELILRHVVGKQEIEYIDIQYHEFE